jgi:hypothetical protein
VLEGDGVLDSPEDLGNVIVLVSGTKQDMHVLGHDHVGPQIEAQAISCLVDGLDQPLTGAVLREQSQTAET